MLEELITIELFGQPYTFKADSHPSQARAVAEVLMGEVRRAEERHGPKPAHHSKLAILTSAALNIAQENCEIKRHHRQAVEQISQRSERLLRMLNEAGL